MNREELINAYLHNKLDEKDRQEAESLYKNDKGFREEFEFQKDLSAVFASMEGERIKAKLREIEDEIQNESGVRNDTPGKKKKQYKIWLAAACILVLIGLGITGMFNGPSSPQAIYSDYFQPYENVVSPVTRGKTIEDLENLTFIAYAKGDFENAAEGFRRLFEKTGKSYYLLYEANAYLAADKPEKAVPLLKKQLSYKDQFTVKSKWYLALAYLSTGETEKAKSLFGEVKAQHGFKASEAEEILEKLE